MYILSLTVQAQIVFLKSEIAREKPLPLNHQVMASVVTLREVVVEMTVVIIAEETTVVVVAVMIQKRKSWQRSF